MDLKPIDAFLDVPPMPVEDTPFPYGSPSLDNMQSFAAGNGTQSLRMDQQGLWLGNENFNSAPFSISMDGTISSKAPDGSGLKWDGANNRILVIDSTGKVRGVWGYAKGLF